VTLRIPTVDEMAKEIAEKAMNEYKYEWKTILQWVEILKDYDDKKSTLERIVDKLEEKSRFYNSASAVDQNIRRGVKESIEIVKEEGGIE
jgi:hypothetical protein